MVQAAATKKHGWLPLLVVLFLISYGLMTMLIVEQGRTIESQRALIRDLFHDSTELSAVKMKAHSQQQAAPAQSVTKNSSTRNPSTQTPSTQAPAKQSPSTQAGSQQRIQNQVKKQKSFQMPSRPASDLMDSARSLITI
jgi:cytoskeletal protein RodZ